MEPMSGTLWYGDGMTGAAPNVFNRDDSYQSFLVGAMASGDMCGMQTGGGGTAEDEDDDDAEDGDGDEAAAWLCSLILDRTVRSLCCSRKVFSWLLRAL